ncbi:hypothetical protein [Bradyrhizobium sacchari]|uniref:Uncharacterized protein n=1 Tax=Bradyrhizobium sacchari TaxID=1399419 RepID=A0A560HXE2_9BRAD|nr:hypothetical protein [Bradyrhizobium sacchari]TWB51318.1 hypothetical protein FBZ94_110148 [Bradyrhizobium sacchari]TWB69552.1 hypothetical protein FBZ95_109148 [Bradyrhizobium sacchari]
MGLTTKELIEIEQLLAADDIDMGHFVELRRGFPQLACVCAVIRQSCRVSRSSMAKMNVGR